MYLLKYAIKSDVVDGEEGLSHRIEKPRDEEDKLASLPREGGREGGRRGEKKEREGEGERRRRKKRKVMKI